MVSFYSFPPSLYQGRFPNKTKSAPSPTNTVPHFGMRTKGMVPPAQELNNGAGLTFSLPAIHSTPGHPPQLSVQVRKNGNIINQAELWTQIGVEVAGQQTIEFYRPGSGIPGERIRILRNRPTSDTPSPPILDWELVEIAPVVKKPEYDFMEKDPFQYPNDTFTI